MTWDQAARYCKWRGEVVGQLRRLPTAAELEKAARGQAGLLYPWGNQFDPERLDSGVGGARDTAPVGSYPRGASPYGVLDLAGNVFSWTSTRWPHAADQFTVKGSAWDDHGGLGRGAAQHGRERSGHHRAARTRWIDHLSPARRPLRPHPQHGRRLRAQAPSAEWRSAKCKVQSAKAAWSLKLNSR